MNKKTKTLVAAAMAGLLAGASVPHAYAGDDAHAPAAETGDKHSCKGDKASCNGKNKCNGTPTPETHDKNSCSGKDGCNGKMK